MPGATVARTALGGDTGRAAAGPKLSPGTVIRDRFVIEAELGRGGMGVVYRARDRRKEEALDRDPCVAIKVLGEQFRRHPQSFVALEREARKAQTLAHPNIITVHDFDREGDMAYMTMELLEGKPLDGLLAQDGPDGLPPKRAVSLIDGMAEALAYAHQRGFVHADFKPGNVFVMADDRVKVLDFGLGRAVSAALAGGDARQTMFDTAELGALTPAYASPEMLAGEAAVPQDDVYALGLIAAELLTGQHPFGNRPASVAIGENLKPVIPGAGLTARQRRAIGRALAPTRTARQPDARAFLREFRPPTKVRRSVYAAMGVLAVALGVMGYLYLVPEPPEVAYEDLVPARRAQLDELLRLGDTFRDKNVRQSAYEAYVRAYLVSEREPRVVSRLEGLFGDMAGSASTLPAGAAQNLWCRLDCLRTNFAALGKNRSLTRIKGALQDALAASGISDPQCGQCVSYRKVYGGEPAASR